MNLTAAHALDLATLDPEAGTFSGIAALWNRENRNGWGLAEGALTAWLASNRPALLWHHDETAPIGRVTAVDEAKDGLRFEAALNLDTERGREARALMRAGDINGVSVGVRPLITSTEPGYRLVTSGELWEVSLVTFPAETQARVGEVASATPPSNRTRIIRARFAAHHGRRNR